MNLIPMILIVLGNLLYHIAQKKIPGNLNPAFALLAAYGVSLVCTALLIPALTANEKSIGYAKHLNPTTILLGISIVAIELGFLLGYRAGYPVSTTALTAFVIVSVLLLPIGGLMFGESISIRKLLGAAFCIAGLLLSLRA
jgi:drug/metabolite transporter (DMT)-like permease